MHAHPVRRDAESGSGFWPVTPWHYSRHSDQRMAQMAIRFALARTTALVSSVAIIGLGCSSGTAPPSPPPTVLVTNAICQAGPCRTLVLSAFIWGWHIPQSPTGIRLIGFVHGATTCVQFPKELSIWLVTVGVDSTLLTWTPNNSQGIIMLAFDSTIAYTGGTAAQLDSSNQGLWPYDGEAPGAVGLTPTFVPGNAAGWSVTFPAVSQSGAAEPELRPAPACTP